MKRRLVSAALLLTSACSGSSVVVDHRPDGAPEWGVQYGQEFWRASDPGEEIDVGGVIDRVSHAIDDGTTRVPAVDGVRYRAAFDGALVRFQVAGHEARLRTTSIRREGRELTDTHSAWAITGNTAQARLRRDGMILVHDQARASGVEIVWVLTEDPKGSGPLEISLQVDGGADRGRDSEGHRFAMGSGSAAGLRVGRATAVDSAGRRWALDSVAYGDTVHFEVPEEILSNATYPLAVDPLISPEVGVDPSGHYPPPGEQQTPEVTFGGGVWFIAWHHENTPGSNNFRIRGARVAPSGAVLDPRASR